MNLALPVEWSTEIPTQDGVYFVRPIRKGTGRTRSYSINVFWGGSLASPGPELAEELGERCFSAIPTEKLAAQLCEPGLEWLLVAPLEKNEQFPDPKEK